MQKARCCSGCANDLAGADPSAAVPLMALNNSMSLTQACSGLGPGEIALWNLAQNSVPTWQAAGPHLRMNVSGDKFSQISEKAHPSKMVPTQALRPRSHSCLPRRPLGADPCLGFLHSGHPSAAGSCVASG